MQPHEHMNQVLSKVEALFETAVSKAKDRIHEGLDRRKREGKPHLGDKIPVLYLGYQDLSPAGAEGFHMVNEYSGSTIKYDPEKHAIVGTFRDGIEIPAYLDTDSILKRGIRGAQGPLGYVPHPSEEA